MNIVVFTCINKRNMYNLHNKFETNSDLKSGRYH